MNVKKNKVRSYPIMVGYNLFSKLFGRYTIHSLISKEIEDDSRILDVGCGRNSPLRLVKKGKYRVGLDYYLPYLHKSTALAIHNKYVVGDVRKLQFTSNSFDFVIAIDVIEHLSKKDGLKMIKEMERVARTKIILTTPNGFLPVYAGPKDNPKETHISGWTVLDFEKKGFKVHGFSGLKYLWKVEKGQAVIRCPHKLFTLLVNLSELLIYFYPSLAFHLFCVKTVRHKIPKTECVP